jgi:hypothetical protein
MLLKFQVYYRIFNYVTLRLCIRVLVEVSLTSTHTSPTRLPSFKTLPTKEKHGTKIRKTEKQHSINTNGKKGGKREDTSTITTTTCADNSQKYRAFHNVLRG